VHKRRSLLEALRTQLKTVYSGVWIQRVAPVRNQYPCITLYAESETTETPSINAQPRPQLRTVSVSVTAWIRGSPDDEKPEADLDANALQIEQVLTIPATAKNLVLTSTDFDIAEDDPELHAVRLTYQMTYTTQSEFNPT
jgi:hypothetical protein